MGYDKSDYAGKPVIAIINTWSDINPCHAHFRTRAEEVKRGVWQAGGFPIEMPAIALAEPFQKPSTMMYRNFLAHAGRDDGRIRETKGSTLYLISPPRRKPAAGISDWQGTAVHRPSQSYRQWWKKQRALGKVQKGTKSWWCPN